MCFDDFDEGDFMDDDSFEDSCEDNYEADDSFDEGSETGDEPDGVDEAGFTARDACILGGAMGFAYEEGLEEAERRKLEKKMQDDDRRNRISKN